MVAIDVLVDMGRVVVFGTSFEVGSSVMEVVRMEVVESFELVSSFMEVVRMVDVENVDEVGELLVASLVVDVAVTPED